MHKSIWNVGGFKGGEAIVHAQARATPRIPICSAHSSPLNAVKRHQVALKLDKVVTRVVTDLKSGWEPKYTRVLRVDFIGEQNRGIKNNDLNTSGFLLHRPKVGIRNKVQPDAPPTPKLHGIHPTQKYFCNF